METEGWLFRQARFVALDIFVSDDRPARDVIGKEKMARAREACISGLRVLAHIALSDDLWSKNELAIQASYIGARLASAALDRDDELTEAILALAQGLSVSNRSFVRALNEVATDRQNYALVLDAALRITSARGNLNAIEHAALERLRTVGKKHGWI